MTAALTKQLEQWLPAAVAVAALVFALLDFWTTGLVLLIVANRLESRFEIRALRRRITNLESP